MGRFRRRDWIDHFGQRSRADNSQSHLVEKKMDIRAAFVVAVLVTSRPALTQTCSLPPGLYSERTRLEERYAKEVGNDYVQNKAVADDLLRQRRAVDQKYLKYMSRVANRTPGTVRGCCPLSQKDPVALRICALSSYMKGGRKNVASFLASVPANEASTHSLWILDEIAHSQGSGTDESKIPFQPLGPVSTYLNELHKLVLVSNQNAVRKYLGLFELADGDAAEGMEDDIEKLFLHKPGLVAENWNIFRQYHKALATVDELMSEGDKRQAVSSIRKECSAKSLDCSSLSSSLK